MAAPMNVMAAVRSYVDKIVGDPNCPGMKVLLLDEWTTKTVAMVYSQTEILDRDVYLAQNHEVMKHLKACVFVRPTPANFAVLTQEVRRAKFSEYHVFFSNVVPGDAQGLGRGRRTQVVRQVQEYYADFVPVNAELFSLNQRQSLRLSTELRDARAPATCSRNVNGLLSALLSLKLQPSVIRYAGASRVAKAVAAECASQIAADGIFHFAGQARKHRGRKRWTYQAMVHELLGLNSNRVKLKGAPGVKDKDLEEVVRSATDDAFYAENKFANFGDLGMAVKDLLDDYQRQTKMNENISSIEDMQSFMERYPARSKSLNATKHAALIGELSRLVDVYKLMDVSQLEQDVACNDDKSAQWREVLAKLNDAGGLLAKFSKQVKSSLEGIENVYAQHVPLLMETLDAVAKGKLNAQHYPAATTATPLQGAKHDQVIVYIVGGVTYEEATKVAELNANAGAPSSSAAPSSTTRHLPRPDYAFGAGAERARWEVPCFKAHCTSGGFPRGLI
ncbi:hypothetical protein JL722_1294 [Aureococcus anophagefferens]|nr:hypothetical protein JL722_1294 [Aureococcus anophagefferens]